MEKKVLNNFWSKTKVEQLTQNNNNNNNNNNKLIIFSINFFNIFLVNVLNIIAID